MSTPFDSLFASSSLKWGVPQSILEAIAWTESSMDPDADAGLNDGVGLMQVTERTAREMGYVGTRAGLRDPATSIELGAQHISKIIQRQGEINLASLYSEYNSGRAELWRSSSQVARHVVNFLVNFARVVGVDLSSLVEGPPVLAIEEAVNVLSKVQTSGAAPLLIALALILFLWKGR